MQNASAQEEATAGPSDPGSERSGGEIQGRARRVLEQARRCAVAATEMHDRMGRLRGEMAANLRSGNAEIARARGFAVARAMDLGEEHDFASMGRMAGSLAHDLNNLLTVILGYGSAALRREGAAGVRGELSHIVQAAQHAAVLTRQILREGRSRPSGTEWMDLDVDDVVDGARPLLAQLLGEGTGLEVTRGGHGAYVRAHPGQIEQVLFNLVVNARDALHGEGTVMIETATVDRVGVDADEGAAARPVPCVLLAVHDTGAGMDEETLARVFEPLFTTKVPEKGSGLGLATVARIAKETGAQVEIESAPKRGCSVRLYFPRVDGKRAVARSDEGALVHAERHEAVLVVDDDLMVRRAMEVSLDELGYEVIATGSTAEAIEVLARPDQRVDLVLTDVEMPLMSGLQLAAVAHSLRPGVRILYASGLAGAALGAHLDEGGGLLLEKPFTSATLAERVHQALSAPGR